MKQYDTSGLEVYAKKLLNAEQYSNDLHLFTLFKCAECGVVPFELTIEHHSGSKQGDFKGKISGNCLECGSKKQLFSFTGNHRKPIREEKPQCECGNDGFITGECERIEGDEGLMGFFDEGVVVGKCSVCGKNQAIAFTD
jgi:hypothetical protein